MEDKLVTTDSILNYLKEAVESKSPISPIVWVDASSKLNVLLGDEQDKLAELRSKVANIKLAYLQEDEKRNVSAAKLKTEAEVDYKEMQKQEMKVKRIEEFIRIAKLRGRMSQEEMRGY